MTYSDRYSDLLAEKLAKLNKRDPIAHDRIRKKIQGILENPTHEYKNLRYDMSDFKRVHIGHFVLVFIVDHQNKMVWFYDYDHHDKVYER